MKKKLRMLFLICGMLVLTPMTARADTVKGKDGWAVVFTSGGKMRSNFSDADLNSVMAGMQPGDTGIITLTQRNENAADTDWYMKNEVLNALEKSTKDAAAVGAKYTYKLVYTGPGGTQRELYNSDKVGGDGISGAGQGLEQATNALKDYFYLDTLKNRQSGSVTLEIALDGNTTINSYQDTRADLQMQFAVEQAGSGGGRPRTVRTGDESALAPLIIASFVSGLVLLILAGRRWKKQDSLAKGGRA